MRSPRIFVDQPLSVGVTSTLSDNASGHVSRVLRMVEGQSLVLFNGDGNDYQGIITHITKREVQVEITAISANESEQPVSIALGLAMSKGDRFDWAVQKSTELGVQRIIPLMTERVEVRLNPQRSEKKRSQWQHIVISACEQCGRSRIPEVASPMALGQWLHQADARLKLVLDHRSDDSRLPDPNPGSIALLIGPEGGLSREEIEAAENAGFHRLQLGPRVLRTETAPLVALSLLGGRWGDLRV
jgi:16S rRNA (uracil1498-N3)-methyltransferase